MTQPSTEITVTGFLANKLETIFRNDDNGTEPLQWQERMVLSKAMHELHELEGGRE